MPASVSSSALAVPHSRIRELAEIAMGMEGVFKLYFGESNVPTPDFIKRAAQKAMADGFTFYTENAGLPSLRKALARYYSELHGVELDPSSEIAITASGVQALNVAIRCLLDPGDEGIVLTPAWPNGSAIIQMANCTPREIPYVLTDGRYAIDFDALERAVTPRTRMLLYTSPSNPLGWVATEADQERLLEFTRRHNLWLMADEVYERLYYPALTAPAAPKGVPSGAAPSILKKCNRGRCRGRDPIVFESLLHDRLAAGLDGGAQRSGWPRFAAQRIYCFVRFRVRPESRRNRAALGRGSCCARWCANLRENRDFCLGVLSKMKGVTIPVPEGAFYLFARIDGVTDSFDFCKQLLMETKVGLAPGVAFGAGGEGNVRICYASDRPILEEAMARVKLFLESRR